MVPYQKVFTELASRKIRYVVAGGFAVNFHQVQRATVDLDLVVQIQKDNLLSFIGLMRDLGYTPRVPVRAEDFTDDATRMKWIREKAMMVFSFIHKENNFETIDVFCEEPFPFDELWKERINISAFGVSIPVVGKQHLIKMKKKSDREKDRFDIEQLKKKPD